MSGPVEWPMLLLMIASFWVGAGIGYQAGRRSKQIDLLNGKPCKDKAP